MRCALCSRSDGESEDFADNRPIQDAIAHVMVADSCISYPSVCTDRGYLSKTYGPCAAPSAPTQSGNKLIRYAMACLTLSPTPCPGLVGEQEG